MGPRHILFVPRNCYYHHRSTWHFSFLPKWYTYSPPFPPHTHTIFCRFAFHSVESLSPSVAIIISVVHPSFYTHESRWEGGKYRIYHFIVNCTPPSSPQMRIIIIITTIIIIIVIAIIYIGIIIILCEFRKCVMYTELLGVQTNIQNSYRIVLYIVTLLTSISLVFIFLQLVYTFMYTDVARRCVILVLI